jgi:hypothetical protein
MSKLKNTTYFVDQKYLVKIGDYLQGNSTEYAFSPEKGEEDKIMFVDNKKRIFAILNNASGEIELASHTDSKIRRSVESIAKSGVKN